MPGVRTDPTGEAEFGAEEHRRGHAHVFRIRLDAEGTSAAEIEHFLALVTARIQRGTGIPMSVVAQVIELADNAPDLDPRTPADTRSPYIGSWYKGRLILAPDLTAQGYDEQHGMGHLRDPKVVGRGMGGEEVEGPLLPTPRT